MEGGEEDIRLRGFPVNTTGDLFIDGMRDPAFYDRDTFALDRVEILRGSASLLFGRGSTGGAVNMVTKVPRLMDEHQVDVTVGSHSYHRVVADINVKTDDDAALRINAMRTKADNNGAGTSLDKQGVAQLEEHLAAHCERGGVVVLTTHHTLSRMPAGYRDIDLGKWAV